MSGGSDSASKGRLTSPSDASSPGSLLGVWTPKSAPRMQIEGLDSDSAEAFHFEDDRNSLHVLLDADLSNAPQLSAALEIEANSKALAQGLPEPSTPTAELIAEAYLKWGLDLLPRLEGAFVLALWDGAEKRLLLARDHFGQKPLYYRQLGQSLHFASQARSLLHSGSSIWTEEAEEEVSAQARKLDPEGLSVYLSIDSLPAPHSIWSGIKKLRPGHMLLASPSQLRVERYWSLRAPSKTSLTLGQAKTELRRRFDEAVFSLLSPDHPSKAFGNKVDSDLGGIDKKSNKGSDKEVGILLSGGLDSTLVAASAVAQGFRPLAFSIRVAPGSRYDEGPFAQKVATQLALPHEVLTLNAEKAWEFTAQLPELFDEPVADPAILPILHLFERASGQVEHLLCGDGADELFGGYETFTAARLDSLTHGLEGIKKPLASIARRALQKLKTVRPGYFSPSFFLTQYASGLDWPIPLRALGWMSSFDERALERLLVNPGSRKIWELFDSAEGREASSAGGAGRSALRCSASVQSTDRNRGTGPLHPVDQTSLLLLETYLEGSLLPKTERPGRHFGLSLRSPFLNPTFASFAASLPANWKHRWGQRKWILSEAFSERLAPFPKRPKMGLRLPVGEWMNGEWRAQIDELFSDVTTCQRLGIRHTEVQRLLREHREGQQNLRKPLWNLSVLLLWARRWL